MLGSVKYCDIRGITSCKMNVNALMLQFCWDAVHKPLGIDFFVLF